MWIKITLVGLDISTTERYQNGGRISSLQQKTSFTVLIVSPTVLLVNLFSTYGILSQWLLKISLTVYKDLSTKLVFRVPVKNAERI